MLLPLAPSSVQYLWILSLSGAIAMITRTSECSGRPAWKSPLVQYLMVCAFGTLSLAISGCASAPRFADQSTPLTPPPPPTVTAAAVGSLAPAAAEPESPAPAKNAELASTQPPTAAPAARRQLVYNAVLQIVVSDIASSLKSVQQNVESLGGYLQQLSGDSITARVPASRFQDAIAAAEKLGEVTQRDIRGQDITEEMNDLQIRLDTALQVRQRLLSLLEKADKTADAIKVEQELDRVIQGIEQLKGKIRFYESQVAFSTLTVKFNSPIPQQTAEQRVPFPWVRNLADGLLSGATHQYPVEDAARHGPKFDLPKSYIRYYGEDDLAEAMSGNEVYIKVQRHENYKGGDLAFWSTLAHRSLVESRCIALDKESDLTLRTKAVARLFVGTRQIAGKPYGYLLAVVSTKHEVYAFEAWGPADAFNKDRPALESAIQSLDVDP